MAKMGLKYGLESGLYCKKKFRWEFSIPEVVADGANSGISTLPPEKGARPQLAFKDGEVRHISEDVFVPLKPDWKPVQLTVFDLDFKFHPIWNWIQHFYIVNETTARTVEPNTRQGRRNQSLFRTCDLKLYNGCGEVVETWVWQDAWIQTVNFQELDMTNSNLVMCDITLRFARAYVKY